MATATTFKFVASDESGSASKRHQVQRACERCRKRKKRCHHTVVEPYHSSTSSQEQLDNASSSVVRLPATFSTTPISPIENGEQRKDDAPSTCGPIQQSIHSQQANFALSPSNSSFNEHGVPCCSTATQDGRSSRFIGDLNPEGIFLAATSPYTTRGVSDDSIGVWLSSNRSKKTMQDLPSPLQSASSLFFRSGSLVQKVLVPILEQECLSALPALPNLAALSRVYFERVHPIFPVINEIDFQELSPLDPARILLQQGMCLAASKNFATSEFLILPDSDLLLSCRDFGDRISAAMRMIIEMALVTNKVVIIQALTLMSQFVDSPIGEGITSQLCGRAVDSAHSLGYQIKGQQGEEEDECKASTTLFCCVWAMDRMNAAFNGRPVCMHERDISKDLKAAFEQQAPCFRLLLQVIVLLDRVIDLYRPSNASTEHPALNWDFPSFEDVVLSSGGSQIGTSALATIETLYHAVAILSCRSKAWQDPQRTSILYLRQSLATSILSSTIERDLHDQLTLFPFVPYAMSLSLSITYREIRHKKLPFHRARARAQFQTICDALSELGGRFYSASNTSEMGKKLLKELDRVFSTVSDKRPLQSSHAGGTGNDHTLHAVPSGAVNGQREEPASVPLAVPQPMVQDFDPSLFDMMGEVDLFGMFDPAFDLDGFDACLEGSLNPALPTDLQ